MGYPLSLKLNGSEVEASVEATTSLLDLLRNHLGVTSPKRGCNAGDCGACAVLLDGRLVNSCLVLALSAAGKEVTTIEGLGSWNQLHPLQEAFYQHNAAQCGFCIPGMILAAKALLDRKPDPTPGEVRRAVSGNLCRCTGYVKIVEAVLVAASIMRGEAKHGVASAVP